MTTLQPLCYLPTFRQCAQAVVVSSWSACYFSVKRYYWILRQVEWCYGGPHGTLPPIRWLLVKDNLDFSDKEYRAAVVSCQSAGYLLQDTVDCFDKRNRAVVVHRRSVCYLLQHTNIPCKAARIYWLGEAEILAVWYQLQIFHQMIILIAGLRPWFQSESWDLNLVSLNGSESAYFLHFNSTTVTYCSSAKFR